jgi:hypothetical protein
MLNIDNFLSKIILQKLHFVKKIKILVSYDFVLIIRVVNKGADLKYDNITLK